MPLRILLIRHGETEWNRINRFQGRSDVPLNQRGRAQAKALAQTLKDEPLAGIFSSPLIRALETAQAVQGFHPRVTLLTDEGLMEMDLGVFEGMESRQLALRHRDFLRIWKEDPSRVRMPAGETLGEVQKRALEALNRVTRDHPSGSTLLISGHNFLNRTLLCRAMGIPLSRLHTVRQGTAALNVLLKRGDRLWVEAVDDRSHLLE